MASRPHKVGRNRWLGGWLVITLAWVCTALSAHAQYLRIVTYNIEADTSGTTPRTGLYTVLEAIGTQRVNGIVQPIDILALEETTSNTDTVAPIVDALNTYYGSGIYAMSAYQGTQYGSPGVGNGPSALIYNTQTVALVSTTTVANTPSKIGSVYVYRQVIRYKFQAVGAASTAFFYVYVSHMKSGAATTQTIADDRTAEAQYIRKDSDSLPAGTSLLYVGDFNMDSSDEAAYQALVTVGTGSGIGQGVDLLNVTNASQTWDTTAFRGILTETAVGIQYRDDIQFTTANVYNGTAAAALRYAPGSYRAFGNNGTTALGKSVNQTSNTALANLTGPITASQALSALTTASDHLPVVADYAVATPYNTWQLLHFTLTDLANAAVSGDLADPDGDGVPNLMEYALNRDPKVSTSAGLPTVGSTTVGGAQYLTLTYPRVLAATGITYQPQVSGDLSTWNGGTGYTVPVSSTNNPDGVTQTVVVRDAVAMSPGGRRFMRLQVSRP